MAGGEMPLIVKEIRARSILSPSRIYTYALNPYIGCEHGCTYCYARYMKRVTAHREPWGEFVDVKVNAPELLAREIKKKRRGKVWISGVCDPYQPLEAGFELTRRCLAILAEQRWPVVVQTRSPLVLRDLDILTRAEGFEVGLTITTADESMRRIFEPKAPTIDERLEALRQLHDAGVRTYAMVAPVLPGAEGLGKLLSGRIDYLLIDRMNYHYADWVYRKYGLEEKLSDAYFEYVKKELLASLEKG